MQPAALLPLAALGVEHVEVLVDVLARLELCVRLKRLLLQVLRALRAPDLEGQDVLYAERVGVPGLVELPVGGPVRRWLIVGVRGRLLGEVVHAVLVLVQVLVLVLLLAILVLVLALVLVLV